jgi:hypothetical protein
MRVKSFCRVLLRLVAGQEPDDQINNTVNHVDDCGPDLKDTLENLTDWTLDVGRDPGAQVCEHPNELITEDVQSGNNCDNDEGRTQSSSNHRDKCPSEEGAYRCSNHCQRRHDCTQPPPNSCADRGNEAGCHYGCPDLCCYPGQPLENKISNRAKKHNC